MFLDLFRRKTPVRPGCQSPAERQQELGSIAFAMLTWAATQNRTHGAAHPETPALLVWKRPKNAGRYTIAVHLPDNGKPGHFFVLNLSVCAAKDEVHVLYSRNGREETTPLADFPDQLVRACAHVQAWRLYPDNVAT